MTTIKTLMLAGVTALSLGAGPAMAQEGGPSMIGPNDYWTQQERSQYSNAPLAATGVDVQSGSSDVGTARTGLQSGWGGDSSQFRFDYGTMANPG